MSSTLQVHSLADLPTEVLVKVVFLLDGYSINNLIEAYPELSRYFLLMTRHPKVFSSKHFNLHRKHDGTDPKQYIKLYEYGYYNCMRRLAWEETLDSLSFVHMLIGDHSYTRPLVEKWPLATFECSPSIRGVDVFSCRDYLELQRDSPSQIPLHNNLILRDVNNELNGLYHPTLLTLTIVFSSNPHNPPQLKNVRLPKLQSLVLVYYDIFPSLDQIVLSSEESVGTLVLVHAPSMRYHLEQPLAYTEPTLDMPTRYTLGEPVEDCTTSPDGVLTMHGSTIPLPHYFSDIRIIGGPVCLAKLLSASRNIRLSGVEPASTDDVAPLCSKGLEYFHWKQTVHSGELHQPKISLAKMFDTRPGPIDDGGKTISYECSFLNPIPFVNDIERLKFVGSTYTGNRQKFRPRARNWHIVSVVYHFKSFGCADGPEVDNRLEFTHRLNEYLDKFLESGTGPTFRVHLLAGDDSAHELAVPLPSIRLTDAVYRSLCYQFSRYILGSERSVMIDVIGCPLLHDTEDSEMLYQFVKTGKHTDYSFIQLTTRVTSGVFDVLEGLRSCVWLSSRP